MFFFPMNIYISSPYLISVMLNGDKSISHRLLGAQNFMKKWRFVKWMRDRGHRSNSPYWTSAVAFGRWGRNAIVMIVWLGYGAPYSLPVMIGQYEYVMKGYMCNQSLQKALGVPNSMCDLDGFFWKGGIPTMAAGGGASVVYADTIVGAGFGAGLVGMGCF